LCSQAPAGGTAGYAPRAKTTLFAGALNEGSEVICENRRRRVSANK
jgi:hypothetical protein